MQRSFTLTAAALILCAATAHAQGIGIKGGISFGDVSNRGLLPGSLDTRTGFALGLGLSSSPGLLGFGAEGLYAQRGVGDATDADSRRLDYIDVPVYLRAMLPIAGIAPFAYAGPQFSFELRCRAGDNPCPDTDRSKTSYSAAVGAGVRLGTRRAITVEGRYVYGLTDLDLGTVTDPESYKTRSFLILVGVGL
jgi:hypothetical protein